MFHHAVEHKQPLCFTGRVLQVEHHATKHRWPPCVTLMAYWVGTPGGTPCSEHTQLPVLYWVGTPGGTSCKWTQMTSPCNSDGVLGGYSRWNNMQWNANTPMRFIGWVLQVEHYITQNAPLGNWCFIGWVLQVEHYITQNAPLCNWCFIWWVLQVENYITQSTPLCNFDAFNTKHSLKVMLYLAGTPGGPLHNTKHSTV